MQESSTVIDIPEDDSTEVVRRLNKDLREKAKHMSRQEARYIVDTYYALQAYRIRTQAQNRQAGKEAESSHCIAFLFSQTEDLEARAKSMLDIWTKEHPMGVWARRYKGVGPCISAGIIAHVDIERTPTMGNLWSFAGLDPTKKWKKGERRPWNASLKVLCWKLATSFVKQDPAESFYRRVYDDRKAYETAKNTAGDYKEQAAAALVAKKIGKDTVAYQHYSEGRLPPGHLHARAMRYTAKMFLGHWWQTYFEMHTGRAAPRPYAIEHMGHAHVVAVPPAEK